MSVGTLRAEIAALLDQIMIDEGGGCSLSKAHLMAWLICRFRLKRTVDIGVYRGRSLFPQALAHQRSTGGIVYGIDPWCADEARQIDNPALREMLDRFANETDFQVIYEQVVGLREQLQVTDHCVLLRQTSISAAEYLRENGITVDLVHIDGNHDTRTVEKDVNLYLPLLNRGGFIVLDDVSWESVQSAYRMLTTKLQLIHQQVDDNLTNDYAVFWKGNSVRAANALRLELVSVQAEKRERAVQALSAQVAERERAVQALSAQVAERERAVQALSAQVAERERAVQALSAQVAERERAVQALSAQVAERETKIVALSQLVAERDKQIGEATQLLSWGSKNRRWLLTGQTAAIAPRPAPAARQDGLVNLGNRFLTKRQRRRLVILDDIFPHLLSAFRIAEYNAYLANYSDTVVYSTAASFRAIGETRSFCEVVNEYTNCYSMFKGKALEFDSQRSLQGQFAYFVFLQNARTFLEVLERDQLPFVFTLYPGGGFKLNQDDSDATLRRVCSLPNLQKVITTQKISHDYLIDRQFLSPEKVEFIYGAVFPSNRLASRAVAKKYYRKDKDTFDICFVAHKYMEKGLDKGYDVFVEVAKLLSETHADIFFHVVGAFDQSDIDVNEVGDRIRFYGPRHTDFFPDFYSRMDIILSPNVPFVLLPGAFDGFPTGCCIEAGLSGVAVFCTDPLRQNVSFQDGEEIVIIPRDVQEICDTVNRYYHHCDDLYRLARQGQTVFKKVFALEAQMKPRLRILTECLSAGGHL
jgi:glycosyltransferase involved in cell wall biosynthesis